ncbi:MAG: hypothetical protein COA47_10005 [Robiginitomaculum sp.]|nr:MAG: hypothetical protein COA47_10005 [Robiginitomaculum sp.]
MEKSVILNKFIDLYTGLQRAHGTYTVGEKSANGKVGGKARTVQEETTREKYKNHLSGTHGIGIVPIREDNSCSFGVIDIDEYNGTINHAQLEKQCQELNLPIVVCCSKSGGAHCYLFLTEPIPAGDMLDTMSTIATLIGHPGVEIFPKQRSLASDQDTGNWINIPYFDWEFPTRHAFVNGEPADLEQFIVHAENMRVTPAEFHALELTPEVDDLLEGAPPCLIALSQQTVSEGGRNNSLYNFGVYCKQRWPDDWESKIGDFNSRFIEPSLLPAEVLNISKSLRKKDYFYGCDGPPIKQFCNKTVCKKQKYGIGGETFDSLPPLIPDSIQKIDTTPPIWIIGVEGIRIECSSTQLLKQEHYQVLLMDKLNKIHGNIKPDKWRKIIAGLMSDVEVMPAPMELTETGKLGHHLEEYLQNRPKARIIDGMDRGQIWVENHKAHFLLNKFAEFLETKRQAMPPEKLWSTLSKMGAEQKTLTIGDLEKGVCLVDEKFARTIELEVVDEDTRAF